MSDTNSTQTVKPTSSTSATPSAQASFATSSPQQGGSTISSASSSSGNSRSNTGMTMPPPAQVFGNVFFKESVAAQLISILAQAAANESKAAQIIEKYQSNLIFEMYRAATQQTKINNEQTRADIAKSNEIINAAMAQMAMAMATVALSGALIGANARQPKPHDAEVVSAPPTATKKTPPPSDSDSEDLTVSPTKKPTGEPDSSSRTDPKSKLDTIEEEEDENEEDDLIIENAGEVVSSTTPPPPPSAPPSPREEDVDLVKPTSQHRPDQASSVTTGEDGLALSERGSNPPERADSATLGALDQAPTSASHATATSKELGDRGQVQTTAARQVPEPNSGEVPTTQPPERDTLQDLGLQGQVPTTQPLPRVTPEQLGDTGQSPATSPPIRPQLSEVGVHPSTHTPRTEPGAPPTTMPGGNARIRKHSYLDSTASSLSRNKQTTKQLRALRSVHADGSPRTSRNVTGSDQFSIRSIREGSTSPGKPSTRSSNHGLGDESLAIRPANPSVSNTRSVDNSPESTTRPPAENNQGSTVGRSAQTNATSAAPSAAHIDEELPIVAPPPARVNADPRQEPLRTIEVSGTSVNSPPQAAMGPYPTPPSAQRVENNPAAGGSSQPPQAPQDVIGVAGTGTAQVQANPAQFPSPRHTQQEDIITPSGASQASVSPQATTAARPIPANPPPPPPTEPDIAQHSAEQLSISHVEPGKEPAPHIARTTSQEDPTTLNGLKPSVERTPSSPIDKKDQTPEAPSTQTPPSKIDKADPSNKTETTTTEAEEIDPPPSWKQLLLQHLLGGGGQQLIEMGKNIGKIIEAKGEIDYANAMANQNWEQPGQRLGVQQQEAMIQAYQKMVKMELSLFRDSYKELGENLESTFDAIKEIAKQNKELAASALR